MIRVMLVDDEEPALQRLSHLIAKHTDLQVIGQFTKPSEALAAAPELRPDAAFLDIEMPGISGLELAERLMEQCPGMEAVMVTAFSDYALQAFRVHAIDYLVKPVAIEELVSCALKLKTRIGHRLAASAQAPATADAAVLCLGGLEVFAPERQGPVRFWTTKAEELFAYLLVYRDTSVPKWDLCELLWPDYEPDKAEQSLHSSVYRLKKTFEKTGFPLKLTSQRGNYRLTLPEDCRCDLDRFERAAAAVGEIHASETGTGSSAHDAAETAVQSYRGPLFAGKSYTWCEPYRERLQRTFATLAKQLAEEYALAGKRQAELDVLHRLTEAVPYDEDGQERLLKAYVRNDDRAAFLLHYRKVVHILHEAFGLEPGEGIRRLYEQVQKG
ncbi:BTAD domain-containing putative transcriptional regulator [Paenibacillus puerhi]|uniref:BTAD domain-containing putative transcriptional regulator n=1 Tax=Paenibacillus puerhi TaxID=2692622 RepID=UPI00135CC52D|nr:BTAD domain-containing putative transcriptional regulator [Paenibacillus puerhi]